MERSFLCSRFEEWVLAHRAGEFVGRANDHPGLVAEALGYPCADEARQPIRNPCRCGEDHVAALDVGPHSTAAGFTEDVAQSFHRQRVLAADIHTAKQRDIRIRYLQSSTLAVLALVVRPL